MFLNKENSIENLVCQSLRDGSVSTLSLIDSVRKIRPKTTKQGFYFALRNLKRGEVVVIHNKRVSFNIRWLKNMDRFFRIAEQHYSEDGLGRDNFLNLRDGEKISYLFASPAETDMFWGHALVLLSETLPDQNEPVYLYNPHEWFLVARRESELECIKLITQKRRFLLTAGGKTPLDHSVSSDFDGDKSQYYMADNSIFPKNNYYLNVIGDFIIEVRIDPSLAQKIEQLYAQAEVDNGVSKEKLKEIVRDKGRSKMTISRDKNKAERLKKVLRKYFYIPNIEK